MTLAPLKAVDLFAGTGWGVACKILGIDEVGVELMPEARATRVANGMRNWLADVWEVLETADPDSPEFEAALLIASPPCQTFSMAGKGAGRAALDEVLSLIDSRAYLDPVRLREFGERHDMRTALVLTPLTDVARHAPLYVVLEQVPQVLPVWQRMAIELRRWGYSVVTGVLNAEQYGVPQTRKRAILIARADGVEAQMSTPTHSAYYPRDPQRLDDGVAPWVSMAEALGRGMTARPSMVVTGGGSSTGGAEPFGHAARDGIEREREAGRWVGAKVQGTGRVAEHGERPPRELDEPAFTIRANAGGMEPGGFQWGRRDFESVEVVTEHPSPTEGRTLVSNYSSGSDRGVAKAGNKLPRTSRGDTEPAVTVTSKAESMTWVGHQKPDSKRTSGDPDAYQTRPDDKPAPTITSASRSAKWRSERPARTVTANDLVPAPGVSQHDAEREAPRSERGAHRLPSGSPSHLDPAKPATTVQGDPRLTAREHHNHGEQNGTSTRVTLEEAAALQTYPATFDWHPLVPLLRNGVDTGRLAPLSKTKAFLQISNAVPPLLALRVLETITKG